MRIIFSIGTVFSCLYVSALLLWRAELASGALMQALHMRGNAMKRQAGRAPLSSLTDVSKRRWVSQCVLCSTCSSASQLQRMSRWVLSPSYHQTVMQLMMYLLIPKEGSD